MLTKPTWKQSQWIMTDYIPSDINYSPSSKRVRVVHPLCPPASLSVEGLALPRFNSKQLFHLYLFLIGGLPSLMQLCSFYLLIKLFCKPGFYGQLEDLGYNISEMLFEETVRAYLQLPDLYDVFRASLPPHFLWFHHEQSPLLPEAMTLGRLIRTTDPFMCCLCYKGGLGVNNQMISCEIAWTEQYKVEKNGDNIFQSAFDAKHTMPVLCQHVLQTSCCSSTCYDAVLQASRGSVRQIPRFYARRFKKQSYYTEDAVIPVFPSDTDFVTVSCTSYYDDVIIEPYKSVTRVNLDSGIDDDDLFLVRMYDKPKNLFTEN